MDAPVQAQTNGGGNAPGHPAARFFHLLFKGTAIAYYLLCERVFGVKSFVTNFVVLLVFISADFWVVKNVTGRLLVGLRWWNDVSEDGDGWRFESLEEGQRRINASDKVVFWGGLVVNVAVWMLYTLMTLFQIGSWEYLLVCAIALVMGFSNVYGYFKCSKEARNAVRNAQQALVGAAVSSVATAAIGGNSNRAV